MILDFTKMEGIGNDYVYVDCFRHKIDAPAELSVRVSDRHFGIGSDGLILICPSEVADCRMDMYNADGSRSEMCGNGIRCVGKFVYDNGIAKKETLTVETPAGIKVLKLQVADGKAEKITVDMGEPILTPDKVPVILSANAVYDKKLCAVKTTFTGEEAGEQAVIRSPLAVLDQAFEITCVSMGNPHCVTFVDDPRKFPLETFGPLFEAHEIFPKRVNAEFCSLVARNEVLMRVWERGSGETLACGTGACAVAVAAVLNGLTGRELTVHLLGGDLLIRWSAEDNHVYMTGPARTVFHGEMEL